MSIKKPSELTFDNASYCVIVQGVPGVGKTTLALSSERPLLIDFEDNQKGVQRLRAEDRRATLVLENGWEDLQNDLTAENLKEYKTIVIDPLGMAIDNYLFEYLKYDKSNFTKSGTKFSQSGWGEVKIQLKWLIQTCKRLKKNLIIVVHAIPEKDGEQTVYRPAIQGSLKNEIFNEVDLACFMETVGDQRTISFTPTDRYSAKGNHGVEGRYNVDDLNKVGKNVFLTKLLEIYHSNIMKEEEINAKYNAVMEKYTNLIEKCDSADGINDLLVAIPNQEHYFSSKEELGARLNNKAKELGLVFNKATKKYESIKDNTNTN